MITLLTDYKTFKKKLKCTEDETRSGNYTIFMYDDPNITAYHEDMKKEYYMSIEDFRKIYKKAE